jgi:g-D-glutamyl-meso-diaminopimelate peptidase
MSISNLVRTDRLYDYTRLSEDLAALKEKYPFMELRTIGYSVMGKAIPALRIGNGPMHVHFNGAFHANEWITSLLLMKFTEDCLKILNTNKGIFAEEVRSIFERCTLWIVPMVNPDGVNLVIHGVDVNHPYYKSVLEWNSGQTNFDQWKSNIRGVDLNDQFPAFWDAERARRGIEGPAPRDYTGPHPLSEPEAQAIEEFTRRMDFHTAFAFHTQGEEIYWNYRDYEPDYAEQWAERLAAASGYEAVKLTGSDAGYKDWFIQEFRRPGFTVEAGLGENPLAIKQFTDIYRKTVKIMLQGLCLPVHSFDGSR